MTDTRIPTLGERIREARLSAGLSQHALAVAASTTRRQVIRWELDHTEPRLDALARLEAVLGSSLRGETP